MIERFDIGTHRCLEFGVEFGYSTVTLSSFFNSVWALIHFWETSIRLITMMSIKKRSAGYPASPTSQLIRSDYKDWIQKDENDYDLIHVDIIHSYADTFACGFMECKSSKVYNFSRY